MFFNEGIHFIDVVVDYDIKTVVNGVVFRDLLSGEGLRHGDVESAKSYTRGGCWRSRVRCAYDRRRELRYENLQQVFEANSVLAGGRREVNCSRRGDAGMCDELPRSDAG